jgi:hypothetical protein
MLIQERRAIDQGPGDVLCRRQPAGGRLRDAHLHVVAQLKQHRIHGHRALGLLEQAAERGELGIDRCGGGRPMPYEDRIKRAAIVAWNPRIVSQVKVQWG